MKRKCAIHYKTDRVQNPLTETVFWGRMKKTFKKKNKSSFSYKL